MEVSDGPTAITQTPTTPVTTVPRVPARKRVTPASRTPVSTVSTHHTSGNHKERDWIGETPKKKPAIKIENPPA